MKRNVALILALAAIGLTAAGVGGGYWFGMRGAMVGATMQTEPSMASADKKPLYYYDPMYPQQKFDKPGKSPFMDMMLVPVFGDDGSDAGLGQDQFAGGTKSWYPHH